jgi:acyl carrier protein
MSDDPQLEAAIKTVMARVFKVRVQNITKNTRRREFEYWDSLGHLALIGALQDEFQIEIPPDEALAIETLEDVKRVVSGLIRANR